MNVRVLHDHPPLVGITIGDITRTLTVDTAFALWKMLGDATLEVTGADAVQFDATPVAKKRSVR